MPIPFDDPFVPYTYCYVIHDGDRNAHVLDPGRDSDHNWATLTAALAAGGSSVNKIASVTVTHLHIDHPMRRASDRRVVGLVFGYWLR